MHLIDRNAVSKKHFPTSCPLPMISDGLWHLMISERYITQCTFGISLGVSYPFRGSRLNMVAQSLGVTTDHFGDTYQVPFEANL